MSDIGKPERVTQDRVLALFKDEMGYAYLGNWSDRTVNVDGTEEVVICIGEPLAESPYNYVRVRAVRDQN